MSDVSKTEIIGAGQAAWQRLRDRERRSFDDWILVGSALLLLRATAMRQAATNTPFGAKYNKIFGSLLRERGFDDIDNQQRYRAIQVVEHRQEIEQWRASLPEKKSARMNHPNPCWHGWKRSQAAGEPSAAREHVIGARPNQRGRPIFWGGDAIRRAADAMRESRSNDWLILARLALQAAIRSADDLDALDSVPMRTPKKRAPAEAAAMAAPV